MEELRDYTKDMLENLKGSNIECADLHNEIFNTDYYMIGTTQSKRWVEKIGAFKVIGEIVDYETFHFGEVHTDCSDPEKVANMYAYIKGEDILSESKTYNELYNTKLDDDDLQQIINDLS
tara:strand:+ start:6384 stop:6743 length:360 start_codon:yes stop_codon:yes gene_type:complete